MLGRRTRGLVREGKVSNESIALFFAYFGNLTSHFALLLFLFSFLFYNVSALAILFACGELHAQYPAWTVLTTQSPIVTAQCLYASMPQRSTLNGATTDKSGDC